MMKLAVFIVCLLFFVPWLISFERRNLYFPDRQIIATPALYRLEFQNVNLTASDHVEIHGWYILGARAGQRRTLLFCHGNAGNISHRLDKVQLFHRMGLNILLFDYRGYGQSAGVPSESGTYADAEAMYRNLT